MRSAWRSPGNAALFKGDWKITRNRPPWGTDQWALYHLASDPGETEDLSLIQPEIFEDMLAEYDAYVQRVGVLDLPEGYDPAVIGASRMIPGLLQRYWLFFASIGVGIGLITTWLIRFALLLIRRIQFAQRATHG